MSEILDKSEARAEFCLLFRSFFGQASFKKKCFWDLLTFRYNSVIQQFHQKMNSTAPSDLQTPLP